MSDRKAYEDRVVARALKILESRVRYGEAMSSPSTVAGYLRLKLGQLEHEEFWCLFLDSQNRILASECLGRGTIDGAAVYPREVVKRALAVNAAAVILGHNHPSGSVEPSGADRALTERLKSALTMVDIRVLDHVVVSNQGSTSFAERGWI